MSAEKSLKSPNEINAPTHISASLDLAPPFSQGRDNLLRTQTQFAILASLRWLNENGKSFTQVSYRRICQH